MSPPDPTTVNMRPTQQNNPLRWVLWGVTCLLALLVVLDARPLELAEVEQRARAERPPRREGGEVLLVVDPEQVRRSSEPEDASFSEVDWSYAWLNTLEQEIGPHTLIERGQLRSTDLTPYRFVIITHSVAGQDADEDLVSHLYSYASSGGVLVLERPSGRLRSRFAADGSGGMREGGAISYVADLEQPWVQQLEAMPLFGGYVGSSGPAPGAKTYLSIDGAPVLYRVPVGRGFAVTMEFDYGRQLITLQQGRPTNDFRVVARSERYEPDRLETSDLIAHPKLVDNLVPFADLLERYLIHGVLADSYPVISMWAFPRLKQGALLMTHDLTTEMGDEALWMLDWEKEQSAVSTWFITSESLSGGAQRQLLASGSRIQLAWVRHQAGQGLFDPVGVGGVEPLVRARSLEQQKGQLAELLPKGQPIRVSRNHQSLWSDDYTGVFQALAAQEISLDTSYSPPPFGRGYSFGTGLPFRALDRSGLPLPVLEHPIVASENLGGFDPRTMVTLLRDSQEAYHEALVVRFDPDTYRLMPSVELFDLWSATYDMARDAQHGMFTMTHYHQFWRERAQASLRSQLLVEGIPAQDEPAEVPPGGDDDDLTARDPSADRPSRPTTPVTLIIEARAQEDGHAVAFPAAVRGRTFRQARWGKRSAEGADLTEPLPTVTTEVVGLRLKLAKLRKGYNSITVTYR